MELESGKKVVIRPNPNKKNILKLELITGKDGNKDIAQEEKTHTRAFGTRDTWMVAPSAKLNWYLNTGLNVLVANPYKTYKEYKTAEWDKIFRYKEEVLLQHIIEYKFDKPLDYYSNRIQLSKVIDVEKQKTFNFWQSELAMFELRDGATVLNLDLERDLVLYYAVKADPMFANSYEEITPFTDYYIAAEHEEESRKANKSKHVDTALARLVEIDEEGDSELLKKFARLLNIATKGVKKDKVYASLSSLLKENKNDIVSQFNFNYNLWKEPITRKDFVARTMLIEFIDYGVVYQRGVEYSWIPPMIDGEAQEVMKWTRREDILEFLQNPEYQKERDLMRQQLDLKKTG